MGFYGWRLGCIFGGGRLDLKKSIFLITTIFLLIFSPIVLANKPVENSLGICDVWFSKDSVNWENATAYTSLNLGQPFYVKVWVKAKTDLKALNYHMSCYGPPYDFELLETPINLPSNAKLYDFDSGTVGDITFWVPKESEENTLIWKLGVKTDSDFADGNVPLNIDFEFFGETTKSFYFTTVSVNIINQTWVDYTSTNNEVLSLFESDFDVSGSGLGFELMFVFIILILILVFKKRNKDK